MNTGLWNMDSGLAAAVRPGMTTHGLLALQSPRGHRYGSSLEGEVG
jgi:hypothetical protein